MHIGDVVQYVADGMTHGRMTVEAVFPSLNTEKELVLCVWFSEVHADYVRRLFRTIDLIRIGHRP